MLAVLSQEQLRKVLIKYVRKHYKSKQIKATKDYILVSGNIPVCLVAHLDTVHPYPPVQIYYDKDEDVIWSPQGLGADDRAGIFAIIRLLEMGLRPHIIFTTDEEKGGLGAESLVKTYKKCPFKNVKYFIELDRQGYDDCVFYHCNNESFTEYIESFGFKTVMGTYTDICDFMEAWGIAGVNLSIGYFNEHTLAEYLVSNALKETILKIVEMLKNDSPIFEYIPFL